MNLHDAITELNDIIFDTEGFAETVVYWPLGVEENKFEVDAIVDWADQEGSNQVRGDGRSSLNRDRGRNVRDSVVIEFPITRIDETGAEVQMHVSESGKDRVVVRQQERSIKLNIKRIIGSDEAVQTVLCTRTTEFRAPHTAERRG